MRYLTAGESHGESLVGIIEGFPANVDIDIGRINNELKRRQLGYGRSERMKIESDKVKIISGISFGKTTGNPISFTIKNRGNNIVQKEVKCPRPGHGDLVGTLKYKQDGGRNTLERSSARETASRVAIGAFCKEFLSVFNIEIYSHIVGIGSAKSNLSYYNGLELDDLIYVDRSPIRTPDLSFEKNAIKEIDKAKESGDSLGGKVEIIVKNAPLGLGSYVNWDRKLDGLLSYNLMSIQGIKSVEIGRGQESAKILGSNFHDEIYYDGKIKRRTNNAGGIEAGVSNGEDIVISLSMKPIPTLLKGLETIDIDSKLSKKSLYERSDICAVPSASIVGENVTAIVLAQEMISLFGGDHMEEILTRYKSYIKELEEF